MTVQIPFLRVCLIFVASFCPQFVAQSCLGDDDAAVTVDTADDSKRAGSQKAENEGQETKGPSYWAEQLGHDRFLRRETATRELIQLGDDAVAPLLGVVGGGNLEINQRAVSVLAAIALRQSPSKENGAYDALLQLVDSSAGSRRSMVQRALEEIATTRQQQAESILRDAGFFIGADHFSFSLSTLIIPVKMLRVGDSWQDDKELVSWIRWLSDIQYAEIRGDAICVEVIEELAKMPALHTLAIIDGDLDVASINQMKTMGRLKELELRYVPLDDEKRDLLATVPVRLTLSIMGTGTSEQQADEMRRNLPGLAIIHHNGGFLGVNCSTRSDSCIVDAIVRNSAAEAAGLRPGDMIIGIDTTEVLRFSDLQQAIREREAGDEIEVRYRRLNQGTAGTVKATLRKYTSR